MTKMAGPSHALFALALLSAGCGHDFDALFEAADDGGVRGASPDGGRDASAGRAEGGAAALGCPTPQKQCAVPACTTSPCNQTCADCCACTAPSCEDRDCTLTCGNNANCDMSCARDADCKLSCDGCDGRLVCNDKAKSCAATCQRGAACDVTCSAENPCNVTCDAASSCIVRCQDGGGCDLTCASGPATKCGSNVLVCNRACP
ncbi:MAG: hypothetical protein IPG50_36790 [Myxococcales bacterium]|nr:hypothetical protein [Myxococcales bacterium]